LDYASATVNSERDLEKGFEEQTGVPVKVKEEEKEAQKEEEVSEEQNF